MKFSHIFLLAILSVSISACEIDTCKDIACKNDGECVDGYCECPQGFSGEFCETENDFSIKLVKPADTLEVYQTGAYVIEVYSFTNQELPEIDLDIEGLPQQVTLQVDDNLDEASSDAIIYDIRITPQSGITSGVYTFKAVASSPSGNSKSVDMSFVIASSDFRFLDNGNSLEVIQHPDYGGSIYISYEWLKGPEENISLEVWNAPPGTTIDIDDEILTPTWNGNGTNIYIATTAPANTYYLDVMGTSVTTGIVRKYTIELDVLSCTELLTDFYLVTDQCNSGNSNYSMTITDGGQNEQVVFNNFYDANISVYGIVDCSNNTIEIPNQNVAGSTWVGTGEFDLDEHEITLDFQRFFTQNGNNYVDNCTATLR